MGGIVGFVGRKPAAAPILDALRRLGYRGYDSAGIATLEHGLLTRRRAAGKLRNLESKLTCEPLVGRVGIGHPRWATHAHANVNNAQPHAVDGVAVVHNGIIENHRELRNELKLAGACFATDTDTEMIAHLVSQQLKKGLKPVDAIRTALPRLEAALALAFLFEGIGRGTNYPLALEGADVSDAARLCVAVAASCVPHRARPGNRRRSTAPSRQVRDCRMIWPSGWAPRRRFDYCLRARR